MRYYVIYIYCKVGGFIYYNFCVVMFGFDGKFEFGMRKD